MNQIAGDIIGFLLSGFLGWWVSLPVLACYRGACRPYAENEPEPAEREANRKHNDRMTYRYALGIGIAVGVFHYVIIHSNIRP